MAFPVTPAPAPGDTYSVDNRVWTFDGFGWRFLGASGSVNISISGLNSYTIGNTAPVGPLSGDKWYHINDAVEYTFLQDYDSTSHWVEIGYGCPTFGGGTGINFPFTECVGDIYEYDGRQWIFNGHGWKVLCPPDGSEFTFGLTAPSNPNPGHRWVNSANAVLYTFIDDENPSGQTGQWVQFGGGDGNLIGPAGPTGPTGENGLPGPTGPTGYIEIFGTPNQIGVSADGSGVTLFLPSTINANRINLSDALYAQYHEGNIRYGGVHVQIRNASGGVLLKGTPVYIVDDVPGVSYIDVARAYCDEYQHIPILGLVTANLNNNEIGYAIHQGILSDINTTGIAPNTALWVASSMSTGVTYGLTINEPLDDTEYKQKAALVLKSDSVNGMLYVLGGDSSAKTIANSISFDQIAGTNGLALGAYMPKTVISFIEGAGWSPVYGPSIFSNSEHYHALNGYTYTEVSTGLTITTGRIVPKRPQNTESPPWSKSFPIWKQEIIDGESEIGLWIPGFAGRGITGNIHGGLTFSIDLNYTTPGVTGLTFATITTASTSDKILLQRKPSDKMELITVGNLLGTPYATAPADIAGNISSFKFAFFDSSGNQYSSSESNVKSQILANNINSLNGCTGSVGITGTTGEIEVTNSCPNIVIGLPDNVSITGNLTVGGFYYGFIDGGTFE